MPLQSQRLSNIENCFVFLVCLFEDVSVVSKPDAYFDSSIYIGRFNHDKHLLTCLCMC